MDIGTIMQDRNGVRWVVFKPRPDLLPPLSVDAVRLRTDGSYERRSFCLRDLSVVAAPVFDQSLALTHDGKRVAFLEDLGERIRVAYLEDDVNILSGGFQVLVRESPQGEPLKGDVVLQNLALMIRTAG